jgi:hypothetical protein
MLFEAPAGDWWILSTVLEDRYSLFLLERSNLLVSDAGFADW